MKKKGQITILIIVAIVILAIVGVVFLLTNESSESNLTEALSVIGATEEAKVVESSILDCVNENARESLLLIGVQGGYFDPPKNNFDLGFAFIPYYYDLGEISMPSQETIEKELSKFVDTYTKECINEISFNSFEVEFDSSTTNPQIREGEIEFRTDLDITFRKDETTSQFNLENHPIVIESSLFEILEIATFITDSHREDPELICISCVADMAEERRVFVDFLDFEDDNPTTLVVLSENRTSSDPYVFQFLNRYEDKN